MENLWRKAKAFAEEAAIRSQSLTSSPAKIADIVSETAKRSKDIAAEASKKAEEFKTVALSLADQIPSLSIATSSVSPSDSELERFGITDDLRDFVKGLTQSTFQNFPIQDDVPLSDVATVSNVLQDLSEWQQKHANLVLTTVKEVSRLRYELCPRQMKDRRFWRIYFTLVNTHVAPTIAILCGTAICTITHDNQIIQKRYEKKFMEETKLKQAEQTKNDKAKQTLVVGSEVTGSTLKSRTSSVEQDLDTFLLGDLEDSDGHPGDGDDENFDDFDKIDNSEIEDGK